MNGVDEISIVRHCPKGSMIVMHSTLDAACWFELSFLCGQIQSRRRPPVIGTQKPSLKEDNYQIKYLVIISGWVLTFLVHLIWHFWIDLSQKSSFWLLISGLAFGTVTFVRFGHWPCGSVSALRGPVPKKTIGFWRVIPSGKRWHSYGKSSFIIGKSTIDGPCSIAILT